MLNRYATIVALPLLAGLAWPAGPVQGQEALQRHAPITGERRPALCAGREAVAIVVAVVERAAEAAAAGDAAKSRRLYEIAAGLQAEICSKPGPEDVVIVRCDLGRRELPGRTVTLLKVTAVIRAEIAKGEQTYYSWTYAPVAATAAIDDAAAQERRWCSEEGGDKPVAPTPDRILQVQRRLYDLGVRIAANGQLGPETIEAVTNFQRWAKLPATGEITEQTLARLNALEAPSPWVAVAFDGGGNYGAVRGAATRRGGEADALRKLRQRSQGDYKVSSTAAPNCIGIATTRYSGRNDGRRVNFTQTFTSIAPSVDAARTNVVAFCNAQKGGGTCQFKEAVCAADPGPPSREERGVPSVNAQPPRFDPQQPLTANSPGPAR